MIRFTRRWLRQLPVFSLCVIVQLLVLHQLSPLTFFNRRWPPSSSHTGSTQEKLLHPFEFDRKLRGIAQTQPEQEVVPTSQMNLSEDSLKLKHSNTNENQNREPVIMTSELVPQKIKEKQEDKMSQDLSRRFTCNDPQRQRIAIGVTTAMRSQNLRDAIRQSWGHPEHLLRYNASLHFFIGHSRTFFSAERKLELRTREDLIQLDFVDSYRNLSLKSVEMLRWFRHNCPNVTYILKQDDDTFVNLKRFTKSLTDFEARNRHSYISGFLFNKRKRIVNTKSRYYVPSTVYNHTYWPSMVTGPAYVVTSDVIDRILRTHDNAAAPFVPFEDIYVTGLVRNASNIEIHNMPGFGHRICAENATISDTSGPATFHRVYAHNHPRLHERLPCLKRNLKT